MLLLLALVALGCSSEPSGHGGQATTIIDPDSVVLGLSHGDVGITVYKFNTWLMSDSSECKSVRGEITDLEISKLQSHMADEALKGLGKDCGDGGYTLNVGFQPSVCWPADKKSPGIDGLIAFFEDKASMLAAQPQGKCGEPQTAEPTNWPKKGNAAAGSGG